MDLKGGWIKNGDFKGLADCIFHSHFALAVENSGKAEYELPQKCKLLFRLLPYAEKHTPFQHIPGVKTSVQRASFPIYPRICRLISTIH